MKKQLMIKPLLFCFGFMMLYPSAIFSRSVAISTSGGDNSPRIDRWRSENVDRACRAFMAKGIRECRKVFTKQDFLTQLRDVVNNFECGDTLVLYFIGHGDRSDGFVFDKEGSRSKNRLLSEDEILDVLKDIACCAKVYIAFHSCYSGRYTKKLSEDPHVAVAVSSSSSTRKAHKKADGNGVNPLNWPDGFVAGFGNGSNLFDAFQKGANQGKANAEETGGNKRREWDDDPLDFKRGHIEEVTAEGDLIRVRLRSNGADVIVYVPIGRATNLSAFRTQELIPCMDITIADKAQFNDSAQFAPKTPEIFIEGINDATFHVLEIVNVPKKQVKVVIVKPAQLCCAPRVITLDNLPADMAFCKFYTARLGVTGTSINTGTGMVLTDRIPYSSDIKGHIIEADAATGVYVIDMEQPVKGRRTIRLKPGQSFPPWLRACNWVEFRGQLTDKTIEQSEQINAMVETFRGHLDEYDPIAKIMVVTFNNNNREGVKGKTLTIKLDNLLPTGFQPCINLIFMGRLKGDAIEEVTNINRIP